MIGSIVRFNGKFDFLVRSSGNIRYKKGIVGTDTDSERTGDQGREAESDAMYDSDMQVYLDSLQRRKQDPERLKVIKSNIALMKKWKSQGK